MGWLLLTINKFYASSVRPRRCPTCLKQADCHDLGDFVSSVPQVWESLSNFCLPFDELETWARRSHHLHSGWLKSTPYLLTGAWMGRRHFIQRLQNTHVGLWPALNDNCTDLPDHSCLKKCRARTASCDQGLKESTIPFSSVVVGTLCLLLDKLKPIPVQEKPECTILSIKASIFWLIGLRDQGPLLYYSRNSNTTPFFTVRISI